MKDILGYEGLYAITKDGRIWSYPRGGRKGKFLKTSISVHGYVVANLTTKVGKKSKHYTPFVHRLYAFAYLPNPLNLPQINHKNGIKTDNRLENLEWCTPQQNTQHGYDIGLNKRERHSQKGEAHGMSKLKKQDIPVIRLLWKKGCTYKTISERFHVSQFTIRDIITGRRWSHT